MHSPLGRRIGLLTVGSIFLTSLGAAGALAAEPKDTSVIDDASAWYTQAYENFPSGGYLTPQQADVAGPQRAPFGTSSHRIRIGESSAQTELYRTNAYDGTLIADLTRLEYSEYATATTGGARQPAYLRLSVDTNDDGGTDDSLFFYPANNGDVVNSAWQTWDVAGGVINLNGDGGATTTLTDYATANPGAKLVNDPFDETHDAGSIALIVGGALGGDTDPQINGTYYVDRVVVGENDVDTLFDFGGDTEVTGATTTLTVNPANARGWENQAYDNDVYLSSNQTLVDGPAVPPLGGGSLRFSLTASDNPARVELFRTTQYDDTLLRDVRDLTYSTYQRANVGNATPQQPVYVRFSVDTDGDGGTDDTLYFYPANNGTVEQSTWQTWDAGTGVWGVNGDPGLAGSVTLADYVVAHPDAVIVENGDDSAPEQPRGGVAFLVGAGGASQMDGTYFLDNITVGTVDAATGSTATSKRFDLEPTLPTLAIGDVSVSEGNSGATLTFPVTLSKPVVRAVTVDYATSDSTAIAPGDYQAKSGTLTIPAGETTGTIQVQVASDKVREANEALRVTLSAPVFATLADALGVGTIVNDDTTVTLGLVQATERRVRANVATFPAAAGQTVKIYRVVNQVPKLVAKVVLHSTGRGTVLVPSSHSVGTKVTMYAVYETDHGKYVSPRATITIR